MSAITKILFTDVIDIKVNIKVCYETMPCQHPVTITFRTGTETHTYETSFVDGVEIYYILKQLGRPIPSHFAEYATEQTRTELIVKTSDISKLI